MACLARSIRPAMFGLFVAMASASCGEDEPEAAQGGTTGMSGGPGVCSPGASAPCVCTDGSMGAQVCGAEGEGFGPCMCDGASTGSSSMTETGATGSTSTEPMGSTSEGSASEGSTSQSTGSGVTTGDRLLPLGEPCDGDADCLSESCSDGVCCDASCAGTCDVCAWDLGASEDGACTPAPFTSTASQACPPKSTCDGEGADCVALCVDTALEPLPTTPADFVFVVDNSGSMADEHQAVVENINSSFAQGLEAAGVDAQVIMVTRHGPTGALEGGDYLLCVPPPLSGTVNCNAGPVEIAEQFAHYSIGVASHDGLCLALDTFGGVPTDAYALHPTGWQDVLRPAALKVLVPISDDGVDCVAAGAMFDDLDTTEGGEGVATAWASALLGLSPTQFGSAEDPRWVMHSFVGVAPGEAAEEPYAPQEPMVTDVCATGVAPGSGYQALSRASGGLRFPSCEVGSYGAYFEAMVADTVARVTEGSCDFAMPTPPGGQALDLERTRGRLSLDGMSSTLGLVGDSAACGMSEGFYIEGERARLCPATCGSLADAKESSFALEAMCQ